MSERKLPTDYDQFTAAMKSQGGTFVGRIGKLDIPGQRVICEGWMFRERGKSLMVARNLDNGTIGVYAFVGKDGASVDHDINWLAKYLSE